MFFYQVFLLSPLQCTVTVLRELRTFVWITSKNSASDLTLGFVIFARLRPTLIELMWELVLIVLPLAYKARTIELVK
jgi:hypothetical protein